MMKSEENNIRRREFLKRSLKAGISITCAGTASYLLYDPDGPGRRETSQDIVTLPNFSVKPVNGKTMCVARGAGRQNGLVRAIKLLGGIERFVKPGETIAIKPNAAFASSPELGATSHPLLISELVRLCLKGGARRVIVTDNPINEPASCFYLSGIEKTAQEAGAEIDLPKQEFFKNTSLNKGNLIHDWPVLFEP